MTASFAHGDLVNRNKAGVRAYMAALRDGAPVLTHDSDGTCCWLEPEMLTARQIIRAHKPRDSKGKFVAKI